MDLERDLPPEGPADGELVSREPGLEDLVELCRELNARGARYVVIGGFAIRAAGYHRSTMDVDLIVSTDLENEARVYAALATLPDQAVLELQPGEVEQWGVVRVSDEILVDVMKSACGIDYAEAARDVVVHEIAGVSIPFASPALLWRMKAPIQRPKDMGDLHFLREYFRQRGQEPPAIS